ncbi:ribonuclease R family protein [Spirochaetota bacterium]
MPISSKNIITFINSCGKTFSKHDIINRQAENRRTRKKGKKKKPTHGISQKDSKNIEHILNKLQSLNFIRKSRKGFVILKPLQVEGNIVINTSGDSIVFYNDEDIIIKKRDINNAFNGDRVIVNIINVKHGFIFGEVKKVINRKKEDYIAKLIIKNQGKCIFKLIDVQGDVEAISSDDKIKLELNDYALIKLQNKISKNRQYCSIEKIINPEDEDYDLNRLIIKHSLPSPHNIYNELQRIKNSIPENELSNRKDYRKKFTVTIDGENAKDFDDAISVEKSGDNFIIFVHIADVSAFVAVKSELDVEAMSRGTSYYLGNSVIPMLPEILSNDLCSLREGVDRLTLSAELTIDKFGNTVKSTFHRGIINVDKRLTYKNSNEILLKRKPAQLFNELTTMYELSNTLKRKRLKQGRLDLNLPEVELFFEKDSITDIRLTERLKSHFIVEEFMLTANEAASLTIRNKNIPALYRIHETISPEKINALSIFFKLYNIKMKKAGNKGYNIQKILEQVKGHDVEHVINLVVLKSLMQASYSNEPLGHFGLGFADYTHFTSPIRRYPDLIVHRCLKSIIENKPAPYSHEGLAIIGDKSSELERIAQKAERDMVKLKSCRLMADKIGQNYSAVISGIAKFGFFVTLQELPIEGMVPMRFLTDDFYLVNEDEYTIIGRKYNRRFRLGDMITVKLEDVDIDMMRIDFSVV